MPISEKKAKELYEKYRINPAATSLKWFHYGLNVELEHGSMWGKLTNVTHNDPDMTAKIVIAHLKEDPKYYTGLARMEQAGEKRWKGKHKPVVVLARRGKK